MDGADGDSDGPDYSEARHAGKFGQELSNLERVDKRQYDEFIGESLLIGE